MNYPCVDLMEENLVADEQDPSEHVFDHRVASGAALMQCIKKLASDQFLVDDLTHQGSQSREHLGVDG